MSDAAVFNLLYVELLSVYLNTDVEDPRARARQHAKELIALGWTMVR